MPSLPYSTIRLIIISQTIITELLLCFVVVLFCFAEVAEAVTVPVLIGSGVTEDNVQHYLDANAMIIGSHFKRGGHWANAVDPERVKRFMGKVNDLRK